MKTYVQIGSNVGNDDFQKLIEKLNERSRIILVEPNITLHDILLSNYNDLINKHDITVESCGISIKKEEVDIYLYSDSGWSSSINRRHNIPKIKPTTMKINTLTFNDLCEKYDISNIEYLSIDTEGLDYEILNSIDLSKIDIKNILFEKWNIDNDDLNENYRTGLQFLNDYIIPKYKDYKWEDTILGFSPTYKLIKIIN